jgi:hypothetical protein
MKNAVANNTHRFAAFTTPPILDITESANTYRRIKNAASPALARHAYNVRWQTSISKGKK